MLYPFFDQRLGEPHKYRREWSSVMRCVAVFVGINHASAVSFIESEKEFCSDTKCGLFCFFFHAMRIEISNLYF